MLHDVHAHLTHPNLAADVERVVARAVAGGVTALVSNGLNPSDNEAVRALAARFPAVRPAYGFYPVDTVLREMVAAGIDYPRDVEPVSTADGIAWVEAHVDEAVAVGEIGLDGYWVPEPFWAAQDDAFRRLIRIALRREKPIIIHTRKREPRALEILVEEGAKRVNWHCFGGKVKLAQRVAHEQRHWFSIPANAPRSESFTKMLTSLPRDRLLLETDCPYLAPEPGGQSEPAHVAGTARYAAGLWGVDEADAVAIFARNLAEFLAG